MHRFALSAIRGELLEREKKRKKERERKKERKRKREKERDIIHGLPIIHSKD